ncbi:hypothetical protein BSKO_10872 [Bryopsis sp. KO-2023]|nr:hypothetical protein BSKO_10872 [Bryopsis sp. KO-2023]
MGLDYYDILGIPRYRQKALLYHPDTDATDTAKVEFARICEAYDVLRDPQNKGFYDLFGEEALKNGVPEGDEGRKGGFYSFDAVEGPQRVFAQFFGTGNPYQALEEISENFQEMTTHEKPKKGKKRTYDVVLSLEEIYHGCTKKVTHVRKTTDALGVVVESEERELTIDVKPGLPDGTIFVFEGEGHVSPNTIPGPVVFVLKSEKHPRFSRSASDLVHKATIPLYHALAGTSVEVEMLEGRKLVVAFTDVVTPGFKKVVPKEGMPKPDGTRGDLIIETEVLFPTSFSETQKMMLKAAFFLPPKLIPEQMSAIKSFEAAFKHEVKGWEMGFVKDQ